MDGTSQEENTPLKWGEGDAMAWKVVLPGTGHASAIVVGPPAFRGNKSWFASALDPGTSAILETMRFGESG